MHREPIQSCRQSVEEDAVGSEYFQLVEVLSYEALLWKAASTDYFKYIITEYMPFLSLLTTESTWIMIFVSEADLDHTLSVDANEVVVTASHQYV
jgi:hypothetical protein